MNIFVTDESPAECARALDNRRLNKMMLETVQLFGYAMNNLKIDPSFYPVKNDGTPFKCTGSHTKHPCTLWLQESQGNAFWLHSHLAAMTLEYEFRTGKDCSYKRHLEQIARAIPLWPNGSRTPFANCSMHKEVGDTILSYRLTMVKKWEEAKATGDKRKSVSFGARDEPGWYGFLKNNAEWGSTS